MSNGRECFIVLMGGSGSMVLESLVHMSALSMMGIDKIHALMLDVDSGNGNVSRAKKTCETYETVRQSLMASQPIGLFGTEVELYLWIPAHMNALEHRTLQGMIDNQPDAQWLSRALYTKEEIQHAVPVGFKGHPNLGVVFMQNLLNEDHTFLPVDAFIHAFEASSEDKMMFVGSCFGGTGAASIPVFGEFIRNRISPERAKHLDFALLVIEPYFEIHPSETEQLDEPLSIDSDCFDDKVRTVLDYYPKDLFNDKHAQPVYQHVYLLGASRRIRFDSYSTGTSTQCNPANIIVWFACTAVKQFFSDLLPKGSSWKTRLYVPWMTEATWEWDQFSSDVFPSLEKKSAQMLQAAILYACRLYAPVKSLPAVEPYDFLERLLIDFDAENRLKFKEEIGKFTDYISKFVSWYFQITTHLPPEPPLIANDNSAEAQAAEMERNADYYQFHKASAKDIQTALEALGVSKDTNIVNRLLESLIHQKFFNAFLLCKLEQMRIRYWPFEGDVREEPTPEDILLALIFSAYREGSDMEADITQNPLGTCINEITKSHFFDESTTVDVLMAYVREHAIQNDASPSERYVSLIRCLFEAIDCFQR